VARGNPLDLPRPYDLEPIGFRAHSESRPQSPQA